MRVIPDHLYCSPHVGDYMAVSTSYDEMFEEALGIVKNRFLLSVLLAKRVAQLRRGAEPLVASQPNETPEQIVFREIIEEKLEWRKSASALDLTDMDQGFMDGGFDDEE